MGLPQVCRPQERPCHQRSAMHARPGLQTEVPPFYQMLVFILWNGSSLQPKNGHGQQAYSLKSKSKTKVSIWLPKFPS